MGSRGRALDGASAPDSARLGSAPRRRPASSRLGPLQSPEMEPGRAVVVKAPFGGRVGSQAADWETDFPGCTAQGGSFVSEGPFAVGPVLGSLSASAVPGCAVCGGGGGRHQLGKLGPLNAMAPANWMAVLMRLGKRRPRPENARREKEGSS